MEILIAFYFFCRRNDKFIYQEGKRSYLNQDAVNKLESISVDKVPPAPNGPVKYRVKYIESDPLRAVSDNWNWGRAQPCPRKDFCNAGRRTLQICKGSFECVNPGCTYKKIQNTTNKVDFSKSKKCTHCKEIALHIECSARKYVENDRCHKKIMVIYVETHDCTPRADDSKPSKESVKEYLKTRPTSCAKQIQVDKVREALLSGKNCEEVNDVASQYSNQRHIQYLKTTIDKENRPGGSDVEAIRNLKDDFSKRGLDENLIMEVGDDFVILSSATKIRLAALITLGIVTEPVSLDGCESLAKDFTEVEMTTYYPLLRRNVKLVSLFSPKPGENSTNVAKMVKTFDDAVNKMFPTVAEEYGLDPLDYIGRGLDPESYVGDEGGGLWKGLCQVKGRAVKNKTISDLFHFKQDVRRHSKYFASKADQIKFEKIMDEAYNAMTSIEAKKSEDQLERHIKNRASDATKMLNFKTWWWRRRVRWQKWCRSTSTTNASSAEVSNARAVANTGYRKRLLDVVTTECSAAILEAAEANRQSSGQKTIGRGPTAADRLKRQETELFIDRERSASAIQSIAENADKYQSLSDVETAQDDYNINCRDTHRSDKSRKAPKKSKKDKGNSIGRNKIRFFNKYVKDVNMDILKCDSNMSQFCITLLDTMGYQQDLTISKDSVTCTSPTCSGLCHHLTWTLHTMFGFTKDDSLVYKKQYTSSEWENILKAFPEKSPLA